MPLFYASDVSPYGNRSRIMRFLESVGEVQDLVFQTLVGSPSCLRHRALVAEQCVLVGFQSVWVVILIASSVGMVLALQSAYQMSKFHAEYLIGALVSLSMAKELGPLMTALLIAGRAGAAMAAELGTMKVSEEVDALRSLGIHAVRYLVVPRFLACILMLPLLTIFAYASGVAGGLFVCFSLADVLPKTYIDVAAQYTQTVDVCSGLIKSVFFAMIIAFAACYQGLKTTGGAQDVGRSTTRAVVVAFVSVLVADYFLTKVLAWTPIG